MCSPCPTLALCSRASPRDHGLKGGAGAPSSGPCWLGLESAPSPNGHSAPCSQVGGATSYWLGAPTQAAPWRWRVLGTPSCWNLRRDAQHIHQAAVEASCCSPTSLQREEEVGLSVTSPLGEPLSSRLKKVLRCRRG